MAKIAELFPKEEQKQVYRKALKDFRLPYWDYFKPRGGEVRFPGNPNVDTLDRNQMTSFAYDFKIPMIFTRDEIMLRSPESKNELQRGANPFRSFRFPSKNNEDSLWVRKVFNRSGQDVDIDVSEVHTHIRKVWLIVCSIGSQLQLGTRMLHPIRSHSSIRC